MIILLNGPTGVGKTEATKIITKNCKHVKEYKVSWPLERTVPMLFSLGYLQVENIRKDKDKPVPELLNTSIRDAQIRLSEDFLKKFYGEDVLGRIACNAVRSIASRHVLVDIGFTIEAKAMIKEFGSDKFALLQIDREGCSFDNDSREWIDDTICVRHEKINNMFDKELYEEQLMRVMNKWGIT